MQILVNSDKNITVDTQVTKFVEEEVQRTLGRFESQLTRVEVHLSDVNSHKPGLKDKRCMVEVRPAGRKPTSTTDQAATVEAAVRGAASKMKNSLETTFGRAANRR